jgi:hypothetical protein
MTSYERTDWRDQEISHRHRDWGFNCPSVDLDFLMVEYNLGKPVAIVEYKHRNAQFPNIKHPTYRALRSLADSACIPFFIAFYWPEIWAFKVIPVNEISMELYDETKIYTEREYVESLYKIRAKSIEVNVLRRLNEEIPSNTTNVAKAPMF